MAPLLVMAALVLGPTVLAGILAALSRHGFGGRSHKWICLTIGCLAVVGVCVVWLVREGPTTDGLLHADLPLRLELRAPGVHPFEIRRMSSRYHEVFVALPAAVGDSEWPALEGRSTVTREPIKGLGITWSAWLGKTELERSEDPPALERPYGQAVHRPAVRLGFFEATRKGVYELRLHIRALPPELRGQDARLLINSDALAYKSVFVKRSVHNGVFLLALIGGGLALLVGLLMHCCGCPKEPVESGPVERFW